MTHKRPLSPSGRFSIFKKEVKKMSRNFYYNDAGILVPEKTDFAEKKIETDEIVAKSDDPTYLNHQDFLQATRITPKKILDATKPQLG
jgi:hypothetical protein